jgi:hypothetical protein
LEEKVKRRQKRALSEKEFSKRHRRRITAGLFLFLFIAVDLIAVGGQEKIKGRERAKHSGLCHKI